MASLLNNTSLLLNPAGSIISYQEDKIYSVIPNNGAGDFTFSGGDGGTRVNQQGYIEQTPANLLRSSEEFNNTGVWSLSPAGTGVNPVVTANATTAPNGTLTADEVIFNSGAGTSSGDQSTLFQTLSNQPAGVYTATIYAKVASGTAKIILRHAGGIFYTTLNLTTEWQRFEITETLATAGALYYEVGIRRGLPNEPLTSPVTCYLWGAMLNIGSTAKPYQPTTDRLNYPRITYQNGRGAILVEPQRTNVTTNSQIISAGTGTTVSLDSGISPDGTQNADKLIEDTSNGTHITTFGGSLGGSVDSSTFCVSIFAKAAERTRFMIFDNNQGAGAAINVFDLGNGIKISGNGTIKNYGNGWYRCIIFPSKTDNTTANIQIRLINTGTNDSYTGDGSSGIFFWGKQIEAGSFPTSYIPTTSATVTRPNDYSANITGFQTSGVASNGAWSMILEGSETTLQSQGFQFFSSAGNYLGGHFGTTFIYMNSSNAETYPFGLTQPRFRIGMSWNGTTLNIYQNGISVLSTTNVLSAYNTFNSLRLHPAPGSAGIISKISYPKAAIYNTALSTTQLQELTTYRSGSGGNISYYGPYTIHTFTGSATFTPSFNGEVEVLVVAGGGAGGSNHDTGTSTGAGGGGAGGVLYLSSFGVSAGNGITVTIGAGGTISGAYSTGKGGNSSFGGFETVGGGNGGARWIQGSDGGSGGGQGYFSGGTNFGQGIDGQGNDGGLGVGSPTYGYPAGGGGGAGEIGGNQDGANGAGKGGDGLPFSITGFSTYYSGGGGGGVGSGASPTTPGDGGLGGGAQGAATGISPAPSGTPNTGGGGGGSSNGSYSGGSGGSGIVIVRYLT